MRRSTPASWNAATGETRAARLDARQLPSNATAIPLGAAIAHASQGLGSVRSIASRPRQRSSARNTGVATEPSRQPAADASTATTADSPSTISRTCRGVAPTRRSSPSCRRRVATTKPKVLLTTKTAMKSATADMIPNRLDEVAELRPLLGGHPVGDVPVSCDGSRDRDRDDEQGDATRQGHECADVRRPRVPHHLPAQPQHHRSSSLIVAAIAAASARSRRPTTRPSSRNSVLWAYDAANGSWVTITTVWPRSSDASRRSSRTLTARGSVEGAGRLVGEQHLRPQVQRSRDRDSLLLPAGELRWPAAGLVGQPDLGECVEHLSAVDLTACEAGREGDVLVGGERVEQVVGLEHERHRGPPEPRQLGLAEASQRNVADDDLAPGGPVEPGRELEQRGLAGSRRAHDGGERAAQERLGDAPKSVHVAGAGTVRVGDAVEGRRRRRTGRVMSPANRRCCLGSLVRTRHLR